MMSWRPATQQAAERVETEPKLGKPSYLLIILGVGALVATALGIYWAWHAGTTVTETTAGGTKTTKTEAVPSDTLLSAGLAVGGALILMGVLWSRIKTIKFAGVEATLDSDEVGKGKDAVVSTAKTTNKIDPETVATATARVIPMLRRLKAEQGRLNDEDFQTAAQQALESVP